MCSKNQGKDYKAKSVCNTNNYPPELLEHDYKEADMLMILQTEMYLIWNNSAKFIYYQ